MTEADVAELNRALVRVGQRATLTPGGHVQIAHLLTGATAIYDGETGAYLSGDLGDLGGIDLYDLQRRALEAR